ncbi:hypothetical protein PMIN01_07810 [Paraphaeosphaeria minitans]|uniref:Uncharacterized protein n=1 Tax=Paraphaeosphaeria minitans TaxID=565426 RepID=A0A9P6GFX4_9PLEO|nr:hypothetical protein PMIN01_07810 [Paraphaeosphaeria minitans]
MAMPLSYHLAKMNPAMDQHVSASRASEYQSAPANQYHSLRSNQYGATAAFPTYTENGYAQLLRDGLSAGQEPELNFAMTEPVQLQLPTDEELAAIHTEWTYPDIEDEDMEGHQDEYAEGVKDDDAEGLEDNNVEVGEDCSNAEYPNIDSGFHSQTEDQQPVQAQPTQQPQQVPRIQPKLYLRFSAKKKQMKEAAEAKKRDSKSPTIGQKRPGTTSIDELVKQHGGGTPTKRARLEGGYTEPKTSSSPAQLTKGQKRHASPVKNLENEHGNRRPQKKAKVHNESNVPKTSPKKKLPPVQLSEHTQKQKNGGLAPSLQEQEQVVFSPLPVSEPVPPPPHRFSIQIPDRIVTLYESLNSPGLQVLPELNNKGQVMPWTANRLTLLYIHSYIQDNIQLCDLITDAWIRAFQERNRSTTLPQMWMPNKAHAERALTVITKDKHRHMKDYHRTGLPDVPKWQHKLPLPTLADDVTDFDPTLLNALYHHTAEGNGARMLWADALALCGTAAEEWFLACKKERVELHADLVFNVMCTTLRSYRRRLTLKTEEVGKDKWCRRYHLHSKWGMECHRPMGDDEGDEGEQCARLQTAVSARAAGDGGDGEVEDDLGADILKEFNNQFDGDGDGEGDEDNDLYDPTATALKAAAVEVDGSDDEDDDSVSEED